MKLEHISIEKPNVFTFNDYRKFLLAFYQVRKAKNPGFSYNVFARQVGMSKTHLRMIMEYSRDLIDSKLDGFVRACHFDDKEAIYFRTLVQWNQATEPSSKSALLEKLLRQIPQASGTKISVLDRWFLIPLVEMLRISGRSQDFKDLAEAFHGEVSPQAIQAALDDLEFHKVISKVDGTYRVIQESLLPKSEAGKPVRDFHAQSIPVAIAALNRVSADQRDYTTTSLTLTADSFQKIQDELRRVREIAESLSHHSSTDASVYQLNIQLFPLQDSSSQKSKKSAA